MSRSRALKESPVGDRKTRSVGSTDRVSRSASGTPVLVAVLLVAGCKSRPVNAPSMTSVNVDVLAKAGQGTAVVSNTDPSAMKLHDISGALLAYYALHRDLPVSFAQLQADATVARMVDGPVDSACPGSDLPYVYTRDGIKLQDREQRIVVYEPAPLHAGFRETITIDEPKPGVPLTTNVIAVPESFFLLHPPQSKPPDAVTPAAAAPATGDARPPASPPAR